MQNLVKADPEGIECVRHQKYQSKREDEIQKDSAPPIGPEVPIVHVRRRECSERLAPT